MVCIGAGKAQLGLEGDAVGLPSFETFHDGIPGRIDEVIDELQLVAVTGIFYREDLLENPEQTLALAVFGRGLKLEEILEGFELHLQQIRVLQYL